MDFQARRQESLSFAVVIVLCPEWGDRVMHLLVVDDDPVFGTLLEVLGRRTGLEVTSLCSLEQLGHPHNWDYDVAIIDYDLEVATGVELAAYFNNHGARIPIVMVSGKNRSSDLWPESIRKFIHKNQGPRLILKSAVDVFLKYGALPVASISGFSQPHNS